MFRESGDEWLFYVLNNTPPSDMPKVIFLLWRVWHHRNNVVHGDGSASISASVPYLVNYLESFSLINSPKMDPKGKDLVTPEVMCSAGSGVLPWVAPLEGEIKVNVDAGWDAISKKAGVGIIVRDHTGNVIVSEWHPVLGCWNAEEAEARAAIDGLKLLIKLGRWPATLETDCLRVAHMLSSVEIDRSENWTFYEEARELLHIFNQISVKKVDRARNGAAHSLARLGKSGDTGSLYGAIPICVSAIVASDCNL